MASAVALCAQAELEWPDISACGQNVLVTDYVWSMAYDTVAMRVGRWVSRRRRLSVDSVFERAGAIGRPSVAPYGPRGAARLPPGRRRTQPAAVRLPATRRTLPAGVRQQSALVPLRVRHVRVSERVCARDTPARVDIVNFFNIR